MDYPKPQPKLLTRDLILRLHSWFLSHRFQLKKWWVILILSADILLVVYIATSLLVMATQSSRLNRGLVNRVLSLSPPSVLVTETPQELSPGAAATSPAANQTDFIARVDNPNSSWAADITYHFELSAGQTGSDWTGSKTGSRIILPEQSVFLSAVGEPVSTASSAQAKLVIDQRTWRRVSDRGQLDNVHFTVTDIVYEPSVSVPNSSTRLSRVTAQITNRSLWGFWTVEVPVVLLVGDRPVAIKQLTLRNFSANESQTVEAQWFASLPSQATADIRPQVDIFDEQNYMK